MSGEHLEWWDDAETAATTTLADFDADPGAPSGSQIMRLYNDKGGVEGAATETGWKIVALAATGGATPDFEGNAFVEGRYARVRILTGGVGTPTGWVYLGPGSSLLLPPIASGEFVRIEFEVVPAPGEDISAWGVYFDLVRSYGVGLGLGHFEGVGNGVVSGVGDSQASFIISFAGGAEDPGGASADVLVGDLFGVHAGVPYRRLSDLVTVGTLDDNGDAPGAGELFYWIITAGASGVLSVTLGVKGATPTRPTPPAGEAVVLEGEQDDSGLITTAMLSATHTLGRFGIVTGGLNVTLHHGTAVVNNGMSQRSFTETFTLPVSDTSYLWLLRDGSASINQTGEPPAERAMLIWEWTTDGSGIIAEVDHRRYIGTQRVVVTLDLLPTLVGGDLSLPFVWPETRRGYIMGLAAATGPNALTGSTVLDINLNGTTIFASQGTEDRRPTVDAADRSDLSAAPEGLAIDYVDYLEAQVDSLPATPPDGARVVLIVEVP